MCILSPNVNCMYNHSNSMCPGEIVAPELIVWVVCWEGGNGMVGWVKGIKDTVVVMGIRIGVIL